MPKRQVSINALRTKPLDLTYKVPRDRSCSANMYAGANNRQYINSRPMIMITTYRAFFKYADFGAGLSVIAMF